ncbi:hypothetical protein ACQ4PT_067858 [Festuca glaucescens]
MAPPSWIWNVSYMSVEDLDNGIRNLKDGEIHVWSTSKWIMLLDDNGIPIIGKFIQHEIYVFKVGSIIEFSAFHALVDHCIFPPYDDQSTAVSHGPYKDQDAVDLLKGKSKVLDPSLAEINPKDNPSILDLIQPSKTWKITYSTRKDLDRGRMKAYDGSLSLSVKDGWISLFDAKGKIVGCRYKEPKDNFSVGAKLYFPIHVIRMGQLIRSIGNTMDKCMAHADLGTAPNTPTGKNERQEYSQVDHYSLSKDLDYSPGLKVAKYCYTKFARSVHPSASSGHFTMVVSFGRASFKLDESSVGIALEAATGGFSGDLKVSLLRDRVFTLCVSTKSMPLNGNPHPLPGQLLPNLNNFVIPQYPEIGWNDPEPMNIPEQVQPQEQEQGFQQPQFALVQDQDHVMEIQEELQQQDNVLEQPVEHEI